MLLSGTDALLGELTIMSAAIINPEYAEGMNIAMNYYFIAFSVIVLTFVGAWVTEKIVEPRLGEYKGEFREKVEKLTRLEKKGLIWAGVSVLVAGILVALLVAFPGAPLRGDEADMPIIKSPFMKSLVPIIAFMFFVPGLVYGKVTKEIRDDKDVAAMMSATMAAMGMFIVIAAFINLFIGSASAKWAMMAPVFVPIMMQLGYSPELTQMAYRVADSSTNIISPLMTYFAIIIAFAQKYDKKMGIGTLVSVMFPYSMFFLLFWSVTLIIWMLLGIDLGPGSPIYYLK